MHCTTNHQDQLKVNVKVRWEEVVRGGNCTVPHSSSYQTLQKIDPGNEITVRCAMHMER